METIDLLLDLLHEHSGRITNGDKWLCVNFDRPHGVIVVYQFKKYARNSTMLYDGNNFAEALEVLFNDHD